MRPSAHDIRTRVLTLLDLIQLRNQASRYPSQLSGGQRQRVALARALAVEPSVLLLDEPFGALDAKVRQELRRWLRDLHDQVGVTSVFVTHDQDEALEVADYVAVMNGGRIEQVGTPDEVYHHPAEFVRLQLFGQRQSLSRTHRRRRRAYRTRADGALALRSSARASTSSVSRPVRTRCAPSPITSTRPVRS